MGYLYILGTILFTVYGQIVVKWRMTKLGSALTGSGFEKLLTIFKMVFDPYIFSALFAAFFASICWMAAMTKFELSFAYPFVGTSFALVMILSWLILGESMNPYKIVGTILIILGIVVMGRGV